MSTILFIFSLCQYMNTLEHGGMASLHLGHDGVLGPGCFKYDTIRDDSNLVMTFFKPVPISAA